MSTRLRRLRPRRPAASLPGVSTVAAQVRLAAMRRRFETKGGGSRRYCEVEVDGTWVIVTRGDVDGTRKPTTNRVQWANGADATGQAHGAAWSNAVSSWGRSSRKGAGAALRSPRAPV